MGTDLWTWTEAGGAFFLGIAGAVHCAAMCGPLVAAYSLAPRRPASRLLDAAYHGGRLLGYTSVGAACGLAGAVIDIAGARSGIPSLAGLLGGLAMVLFGLAQLGLLGKTPRLSKVGASLQRLASAGLERGGPQATFVLGALSCLFPCGLLYAAYARAAATGHPARAAAFMLIFALSTAPALLVVARLSRLIAGRRQALQRIAQVVIILMGLALIANAGRVYLRADQGAAPDCPACAEDQSAEPARQQ